MAKRTYITLRCDGCDVEFTRRSDAKTGRRDGLTRCRSCSAADRAAREPRIVSPEQRVLLAARAKAIAIKSTATRTRGLAFTIDIDVAAGLILGDCRYCGTNDLEVLCVEGHGHTATPINGLDRVDSSRGYHLDNVVTACKRCNVSKSDLTLEEFKKHVETMYRYLRATGWQVSPTE